MDQALAFAKQMSEARLLPAHLQKSPADCLRVVLQAARWQMDPFAVADKTSIIQNKLMYEGQLVSAVVNARGNLSKRLEYKYTGEGDARVLTVSGTIRGENEARSIELPFSLAKRINKNGQMQLNPDQQAAYIGARIWARRHMPELMLGVYTPDEIDETDSGDPKNVTPEAETAAQTRPEPPPSKPRGARAVAEVVVPQESQQAAQSPSQTPEATTPVEPATPVEQAPVTPMPKLTLKEGEKFVGTVTVEDSGAMLITIDGVQKSSVKAQVTGEYKGLIYHKGGGVVGPDQKAAVPPIWAKGSKIKVSIVGHLNNKMRHPSTKDPQTGVMVLGALIEGGVLQSYVQSVEAVELAKAPETLEEF